VFVSVAPSGEVSKQGRRKFARLHRIRPVEYFPLPLRNRVGGHPTLFPRRKFLPQLAANTSGRPLFPPGLSQRRVRGPWPAGARPGTGGGACPPGQSAQENQDDAAQTVANRAWGSVVVSAVLYWSAGLRSALTLLTADSERALLFLRLRAVREEDFMIPGRAGDGGGPPPHRRGPAPGSVPLRAPT